MGSSQSSEMPSSNKVNIDIPIRPPIEISERLQKRLSNQSNDDDEDLFPYNLPTLDEVYEKGRNDMQQQINNSIPTDSGEKYNAVQSYRIKFTERAEHDVNMHASNVDGVLAEVEKRESQQHKNSDRCEIPMKEILNCYNQYSDVLKCNKYVQDFQECSRKL